MDLLEGSESGCNRKAHGRSLRGTPGQVGCALGW
jgi:hypothetical protein